MNEVGSGMNEETLINATNNIIKYVRPVCLFDYLSSLHLHKVFDLLPCKEPSINDVKSLARRLPTILWRKYIRFIISLKGVTRVWDAQKIQKCMTSFIDDPKECEAVSLLLPVSWNIGKTLVVNHSTVGLCISCIDRVKSVLRKLLESRWQNRRT